MFDARSLLESLVRGAGQPVQQTQGGGGLGDLLGQLAKGFGQPAGPATGGANTGVPAGGIGGLEDLLRNMAPQAGQPAQASAPAAAPAAPGGGGLADILGKLQQQMGAQGGAGGGGLMDILGQVLGQATAGVKEGAQRVDQTTGASGHMRDAIGQATGKSPEELLNQLKELVASNKLGAGAAAGGLGAIVLGTQAGRALAGSAIKLGALALIGGLAYKAVQNYQQGKPLLGPDQQMGLVEAPRGSGFEAGAVTQDAALLYIRGMIAAAASDGRIDAGEQQRIIGGLKQAGLDAEAEEFLAKELNHPARAEDLASAVASEQEAVQLFTAARVAIDLDTREEHEFLVGLANNLGLDGKLVAHIDAAARAA